MSQGQAGLFTTEGGPIPLRGVDVTGEVLGSHARVQVRQRYQNGESRPIEAVYTFPLPSESTLIGFRMTVSGRVLEGVVKEREAAFRAYDDAVWAGHGAALLDQERPNVFTAQVGNLLPGEETLIEIEYLERVRVDEGAIRWSVPTLVAPRYIPGAPAGDRTGHGTAEPTSDVPDADRITPPTAASGQVPYGLRLDLTFDLGRPVAVESPSHAISVREEAGRTHVAFAREQVALDRDVVLIARGLADEPLTTVRTHKPADGPGYFALTVIPDLAGAEQRLPRQDVVFVIDTSGSMEGASLPQAQAALRLCLRHLREGDRFNVIEFNSRSSAFQPRPVPFTQRTLEQADQWVMQLQATGGTEMLAPLLEAAGQVPDGVIVLLTDGQVGNESAILAAVLKARKTARVYPFGIGTNVSDVLLRDLARHTGGACELIFPGERIDEKVVAQFARAIAPRVTGVAVKLTGVEVHDLSPSPPQHPGERPLPALVDGEPWAIFGRIETGGWGSAVITGQLDGKPFRLEVPLDLQASASRPAIAKLWAAERIRELSDLALSGRREGRMKERIVELAVAHGVSSPHTSFVVVETRSGDRRVQGQPETRVVPVSLPAGWDALERARKGQAAPGGAVTMSGMVGAAAPMARMRTFGAGGYGGPAAPPPASGAMPAPPSPSMPAPAKAKKEGRVGGVLGRAFGKMAEAFRGGAVEGGGGDDGGSAFEREEPTGSSYLPSRDSAPEPLVAREPVTPYGLLAQQRADGLWEAEAGAEADVGRARATARALLMLLDRGVTTSDALHGAQVRKAVEALLQLALAIAPRDAAAAELALGVAWLVAAGPRSRKQVEQALQKAPALAGLTARLADSQALRSHLDTL